MRAAIVLLLLCVVPLVVSGQEYTIKSYKIENGLPTEFVKAIAQDSLGDLWIATDEGFVKYNATHFETYRKVTHSNYTKGFYKTKSGRLLAFADLDLLELKIADDSLVFKSLVPVGRAVSDSSLSYPKLVYEDASNSLWISESQSVVKLNGEKFKRYDFGLADRTPQFLRSFSFFEDQKDLYVISVPGNVFRYDKQKDQFVTSDYKFPAQIEYAGVLNNKLVIGALNGLYTADLQSDGTFSQPKLTFAVNSVSYVSALPHGNYFVATRGSQHFVVDSTFTHQRLAINNVNDINHVYVSTENDIWLSTNEGIVLMQEAALQGPLGKSQSFIETISTDASNPRLYYYATRDELHSIDVQTYEDNLIIKDIKDSYFQSIVSTKKGLWTANAFRVLFIEGNKIKKTFDFSDQRMFVTSLAKDQEDNVWLTIPGRREVLMIDNELSLHAFSIPLAADGFINDVRDGGNGIYAVSNGSKYLFYKAYSDSTFKDISLPVTLKPGEQLNTFGLFVKNESIWLATSVGLLKYDHKTISRVEIDQSYDGLPIRSICPNGQSGFLLATPKELLYYDVRQGDGNLFASSTNLSGLTVNARSILISHDKKAWIGTSRGVYRSSRKLDDKVKTQKPQLAFANADRKRVHHLKTAVLPYNVLLTFGVTSITFPEEERIFEFRKAGEQKWNRLNGASIDVITSQPGDQYVEVRARKTGPFDWSDVTVIPFTVARPFWKTAWFYLSIIVCLIVIVAVTVVIVRAIEQKQKLRLETMVEVRTQQLNDAIKELEAFSYSVSHDLRAPLRSILSFSTILEEDYGTTLDDEGRRNIATILRNANKMNQLIDDLLRFSQVLHQGLSKSSINFNDVVSDIVNGLRETGYKETVVNVQPLPTVNADYGLILQVWSNLISNAMKYSSKREHPQLDITFEEKPKEYVFSVKDNGAGFDMQYAEKLFGVFQRLHSDKEFPGIGIGLALVRRIVNRHDGKIWAVGKIGEGATFYFSLPK